MAIIDEYFKDGVLIRLPDIPQHLWNDRISSPCIAADRLSECYDAGLFNQRLIRVRRDVYYRIVKLAPYLLSKQYVVSYGDVGIVPIGNNLLDGLTDLQAIEISKYLERNFIPPRRSVTDVAGYVAYFLRREVFSHKYKIPHRYQRKFGSVIPAKYWCACQTLASTVDAGPQISAKIIQRSVLAPHRRIAKYGDTILSVRFKVRATHKTMTVPIGYTQSEFRGHSSLVAPILFNAISVLSLHPESTKDQVIWSLNTRKTEILQEYFREQNG